MDFRRKTRGSGRLAWALVLGSLCAANAAPASAEDEWPENTIPLFKIERSKNANIVQYDLVLDENGQPREDEPIIGYWIRLAEDGQRQGLSWIQRKLAYGFETSKQDDGSFIMDMNADIHRALKVYQKDGEWITETRISGRTAIIQRIYVESTAANPLPRVEYVDLFGIDSETGEPVTERMRKRG
jgi:hypothetical protein